MNKFAVIDIGSNSVRLMFVANGKILYKTLETTRLGEGLSIAPVLNSQTIERSALAVKGFYEKAKNEGAEKIFAFATAAVRTAKNGSNFTARVKELCGVEVEIVSGEAEAELGILGALGEKDGGIIDIGGASTEIIFRTSGKIVYRKSVDVGVVRLKELCGRDKIRLEAAGKNAAYEFGKIPNGHTVYAIGGTATTLAAVYLGLEVYAPTKITGTEISLLEIKKLTERFFALSVEEIEKIPCVPEKRADVITGGVALLSTLMQELGIDKIIVSDSDNLEGYAKKCGLME
ncbi:MAG: hypothetical protein IJ506_06410 [Clostridia bacterium]|nr:hypothetical protein [Clostridia bacterium]